MAHILILENYNSFFKGLFSIAGITPITTKKLMWDLEVTVFKRVEKFLWYSCLNERNHWEQ